MMTDTEIKKHPEFFQALREASGGDSFVFNALVSCVTFAHVVDDLVDELKLEGERKEQVAKALYDFVVDLLLNPFVVQHRTEFKVLLTQMIGRWLDGDRMEAAGSPLAPAVRCGDTDFVVSVAELANGWTGLRQAGAARSYDVSETKKD